MHRPSEFLTGSSFSMLNLMSVYGKKNWLEKEGQSWVLKRFLKEEKVGKPMVLKILFYEFNQVFF